MLEAAPAEISGQALFDAVTHEHDLRNALGAPGARDTDAVEIAWDWILAARTQMGAPPIKLVTETGARVAGQGEPKATVEAPRFELLRASAGRRSAKEVAAYRWDPKPDPALLLASTDIFSLRTDPLNE
jgi:hypothetical protein